MAEASTIKEIKGQGAGAKTKYQAQVWHKGVFYCSKTFDLRPLAVAFKKANLQLAIAGKLKPASERKRLRAANTALDHPMTHWSAEYVQAYAKAHGATRLADYALVGRLLAHKTMRDFDGSDGATLIEQLKTEWYTGRLPRTNKPRPAGAAAPQPLAPNTVRLRLTALQRLLRFANAKLPKDASYQLPALDDLFEFRLPPAHAAPRERLPTDDEYRRLLQHFGVDSPLGHFLRVVDEGGFRLGEVRNVLGEDVQFFTVNGQPVGGVLTLKSHKTSSKVGTRKVPLSRFAAELLFLRKRRHGSDRLFPELGNTDSICKAFDEACRNLDIDDLIIKDYRRAFINRNKYCVAHVDLRKTLGSSSLLGKASGSEQAVQAAVGHTSIDTTAGYAQPNLEHLAHAFTRTSRWPHVSLGSTPEESNTVDAARDHTQDLLEQLRQTVEELSEKGVTVKVALPAFPLPVGSAIKQRGVPEVPTEWALL